MQLQEEVVHIAAFINHFDCFMSVFVMHHFLLSGSDVTHPDTYLEVGYLWILIVSPLRRHEVNHLLTDLQLACYFAQRRAIVAIYFMDHGRFVFE